MRFDDTLATVMAMDLRSPSAAQSAWRQLVDLVGRRRAPADPRLLDRLDEIRSRVPKDVRVASAISLQFMEPPVALVQLFVVDEHAVAAPVLRSARLSAEGWNSLLPHLSPAGRAILRTRRDLHADTHRALESFGPIDFVLPNPGPAVQPVVEAPKPAAKDDFQIFAPALPNSSFVSFAKIARGIPVVAEALRQADHDEDAPVAAPPPAEQPVEEAVPEGPFEIAEVVARIEDFFQKQEDLPSSGLPLVPAGEGFRFETDAQGVIRWVEGVSRAPVIGISLDHASPAGSHVDGVAAGGFRQRASFDDARMAISSESDAGGDWRISGIPVFDPATGRFTGYRGIARRPRADEFAQRPQAVPTPEPVSPQADSLRQLVHELRTPTNAIAGFAEMIETEVLGPVAEPYRAYAAEIRSQTRYLLAAIDDLDIAARMESQALDLYPSRVSVRPLLAQIADDLAQLSNLRSAWVALPINDVTVSGDARAVERLLARLLATLLSAGSAGECIGIRIGSDGDVARIAVDRPAALSGYPDEALLGIDDEVGEAGLLGTGFALRLVRNLARELGGSLSIGADALTLQLPAAVAQPVEQVRTQS